MFQCSGKYAPHAALLALSSLRRDTRALSLLMPKATVRRPRNGSTAHFFTCQQCTLRLTIPTGTKSSLWSRARIIPRHSGYHRLLIIFVFSMEVNHPLSSTPYFRITRTPPNSPLFKKLLGMLKNAVSWLAHIHEGIRKDTATTSSLHRSSPFTLTSGFGCYSTLEALAQGLFQDIRVHTGSSRVHRL